MTEQEAIAVFEAILAIDYIDTIPKYYKATELAVKDIKEIQQYRAIGTPEEFRVAVEKQKAKKPDFEGDGYADGHLVYDTWISPCCKKQNKKKKKKYDLCPNGGQKLNWRD